VWVQNVQYPYRVLSVPTECLACLQNYKCLYKMFIVPTDYSRAVQGV
jgi:hypothetical protein